MKKTLAIFLIIIIGMSTLAGCLEGNESTNGTSDTENDTSVNETDNGEESTSQGEENTPESNINCGTTENGDRWFYAHVSEITKEYIAVIPYANTLEAGHAGNGVIIVFLGSGVETESDLEINNTVCITYNGTIATSEPPRILSASSIELVKERT